ncbi:hypothetical protein [Nocardia sp. NPDC052316]|uniref:hypothetical protein n=1 Tax=Nocardia sp. NPDC052316 TaxID=3364329 RepID=UPI0037C89B77
MKHIGKVVPMVGAVLLLALGPAGTAQAATGDFIYTSPDGTQQRLQDPEDGKCYRIVGVDYTENATDRAAETFRNSDCSGTFGELFPPGTREYRSDFQSVRFGRPI